MVTDVLFKSKYRGVFKKGDNITLLPLTFLVGDNGAVLIDWVLPEYLTVMEENSGSR